MTTRLTVLLMAFSWLCLNTVVLASDKEYLPQWLYLDAEYRVQTSYINPLELSGTTVREISWTEQRMRLDVGLKHPYGGIYIQVDVLDGVLFGDNGDFGSEPGVTSGLALTSTRPNQASYGLGSIPGSDPVDPDNYVPTLRPTDWLEINQAYGEVRLPIGLVRIGRQPMAYGDNITAHQGTRVNRWGVSRYSHIADRILFGTKLDQLVVALRDGAEQLDDRPDRGVILALAYDWGTQDDLYESDDDLHRFTVGLQWLVPEADWFGLDCRNIMLTAFASHRFSDEFDTAVWGLPFRFGGIFGPISLDLQYALILGETSEISEGFAVLMSKDVVTQDVVAMGAHARIDFRWSLLEFGLQFDYASGDDDPRSTTDLTTFSFDRDYNVGLLLFEHILAFESGRSAEVGIENLTQLESDSFPLTEVATQGRITNAIIFFPQVKVDVLNSCANKLHFRFGALFAWPAASGGAVDPIMTALQEDGLRIDDDAINYHGGDPGSYYGTELDLQIQWTYQEFFEWTIESAVLFPGSSLQDEHGDAVNSFLFENRFTFIF